MNRPLAASLALAAFAACVTPRSAQQLKQAQEEIQLLEDRRSLGGGRLFQLAADPADAEVRARALLALGRIQDPSAVEAVVQGLSDPEPAVRDRAAFAAGLLGQSWDPLPDEARDRLALAVIRSDEEHPEDGYRRSHLDALTRLRGPHAVGYLARVVRSSPAGDGRLRRAAIGLGVVGKKESKDGRTPDDAVAALAARWKEAAGRPELRHALAYGLGYSKSPSARPLLRECLQAEAGPARRPGIVPGEHEAQALCARGLFDAGTAEDVPVLRAALAHPDSRVGVEAVRTLSRWAGEADAARAQAALEALGDLVARVDLLARGDLLNGAHPLLLLAKIGLPAAGQPLLQEIRGRIAAAMAGASPQSRQDLAKIDCRLAAAQDQHAGRVAEVQGCGQGLPPEAWRLALALGQMGAEPKGQEAERGPHLASFLDHPSPTVRSAALRAVAALKYQPAAEKVRALIASEDLVVAVGAAAAAGELGDAAAAPAIRALAVRALETAPDSAEPVATALVDLKAAGAAELLRGWLAHPHAHVRTSAAGALRKLDPAARISVSAVEARAGAAPLPSVPEGAALTFRTEKGELRVVLDTRSTPLTSANLFLLAKKGYFDGIVFHRVEPDFVVQGGDPRGDGEGGPGYTIRCEVSDRRYVRGTVGMALSGKDTGGSQFFFAISDQPHLEGRYTAFGEVEGAGMEVVERLMEGDRIESVTATP